MEDRESYERRVAQEQADAASGVKLDRAERRRREKAAEKRFREQTLVRRDGRRRR
jgi:hypothetical protein